MADKRPALGRGLSALIPESAAARQGVRDVDLDLIEPNRFQPRVQFDEAALAELVQSIRTHGVIQPILVRQHGARFEIIAGERRWRAAQRAGLLRVPVLVREVPDDKLLEVALIENVQREDLNPIDEAKAYQRLIAEFGLTQEDVAAGVGKDRSSVANHLRLLKLPPDVQGQVASGGLSMGHARALLGLPDAERQREAARQTQERGLSVRETEALVHRLLSARPSPPKGPAPTDVHARAAEEKLRLALGTRVRILRKGKGGRIEVDFVSEEELQRLYERLLGR